MIRRQVSAFDRKFEPATPRIKVRAFASDAVDQQATQITLGTNVASFGRPGEPREGRIVVSLAGFGGHPQHRDLVLRFQITTVGALDQPGFDHTLGQRSVAANWCVVDPIAPG